MYILLPLWTVSGGTALMVAVGVIYLTSLVLFFSNSLKAIDERPSGVRRESQVKKYALILLYAWCYELLLHTRGLHIYITHV